MSFTYLRIILFLGACSIAVNAQNSHPRLQLIGHLPYDSASLAGCLGYVDSAGVEYALVGASTGLSIVDLSDPTQPLERFHVPIPPNNWRELHALSPPAPMPFGSPTLRAAFRFFHLSRYDAGF